MTSHPVDHGEWDDPGRIVAGVRSAMASRFDATVVAHDLSHLERVERVARTLAVTEGADVRIVSVAAYLHDFHRLLESATERHVSPEEAEPEVRRFLGTLPGVPSRAHDPICEAIAFTERYRCAGDHDAMDLASVEARVVRDADMLDALGAVGIARAFLFGGFLREPIWVPHEQDDAGPRPFQHGKTSSVVHHFHEKLLRLEDEMLTDAGRTIARERTQYMRSFLDRLMQELQAPSSLR